MPAEKERPQVPSALNTSHCGRPQWLGSGAAEPVAAVMVDGEHHGGDYPGYGVDQQQVLKRRIERHNRKYPDHPEHDGAKNREQHGLQAHAGAANGSRRVLDNRENRIERRNEMEDGRGVRRD